MILGKKKKGLLKQNVCVDRHDEANRRSWQFCDRAFKEGLIAGVQKFSKRVT
jgi:hypothetical protein